MTPAASAGYVLRQAQDERIGSVSILIEQNLT